MGAALRTALAAEPGVFGPVRSHPATETALVEAYREFRDLSSEALSAVAAQSRRAHDVVRLHDEAHRALAPSWYDEEDLLDAATEVIRAGSGVVEGLGRVVVYLPERLTRHGAALLQALAEKTELVVVAGTCGDPAADADSARSVGWLAGPGVEPPNGPDPLWMVDVERTRVVTVSDADEEVRAALRAIVVAARTGTPLDRIAVLFARPEPYRALGLRAADGRPADRQRYGGHAADGTRRGADVARFAGPPRRQIPARRRVRLAGGSPRAPPRALGARGGVGAPLPRRGGRRRPTRLGCTARPSRDGTRRNGAGGRGRSRGSRMGGRSVAPGRRPRPLVARVRARAHRRPERGVAFGAPVAGMVRVGATAHGRAPRPRGGPSRLAVGRAAGGRAGRSRARPARLPGRDGGTGGPRRVLSDPRARARVGPGPGGSHGRGRLRRTGQHGGGARPRPRRRARPGRRRVPRRAAGRLAPPGPRARRRARGAVPALVARREAAPRTAGRPRRSITPSPVRAAGRPPRQQGARAVALGPPGGICAGGRVVVLGGPAGRGAGPRLARARRVVRRGPPGRRVPRHGTGVPVAGVAGRGPAGFGRRRRRPRGRMPSRSVAAQPSPASTAT